MPSECIAEHFYAVVGKTAAINNEKAKRSNCMTMQALILSKSFVIVNIGFTIIRIEYVVLKLFRSLKSVGYFANYPWHNMNEKKNVQSRAFVDVLIVVA